jgi:hypothetical protein
MDADEITQQALEYYERSAKTLEDQKNCIWVCAMRLMKARDPEATAHVSMIGHRIGLSEYEINSATTNAAKRTGWTDTSARPAPKPQNDEYSSDVRELAEHTARANLGDCPACRVRMAGGTRQHALMSAHALANGMSFFEMWEASDGDVWEVDDEYGVDDVDRLYGDAA